MLVSVTSLCWSAWLLFVGRCDFSVWISVTSLCGSAWLSLCGLAWLLCVDQRDFSFWVNTSCHPCEHNFSMLVSVTSLMLVSVTSLCRTTQHATVVNTTSLCRHRSVSYQAEHSIPPSDRQIIMSEVWASIILYWPPYTSLFRPQSCLSDLVLKISVYFHLSRVWVT